jgi:membrane fusion protein, adhesin transport system
MLNISDNYSHDSGDIRTLDAYKITKMPRWHLSFRRLLLLLFVVFVLFMMLPWTQNVRADGRVTTLRPEQRPQTIHATISGRIEHWYVVEGQAVKRGDTILYLSEVKSDYFDPQLVDRMGDQVSAKQGSIASYNQKAGALGDQVSAIQRELTSKTNLLFQKMEQTRLKLESDSIKVVQANIDLEVAKRQYEGTKNLYDKGLKSLTELEEKRLKKQETETKIVAAENQVASDRNDLEIYRNELTLAQHETANKIAKSQSEQFSTMGEKFNAQASVSKLQTERENYARRASFYYILAPQDGFIVKTMTPGIGEIVKEGTPVVSIQPAHYQLAVELYLKPVDVPLVAVGNKFRFVFDGWPSFFFHGWPGVSLGTFGGKVVAIDRNISANGKFRMLVSPDPDDHPWPTALLPGGGAQGVAQLNNVPVWYELWRVLNGFPPDRYQVETENNKSNEKAAK